MRTMFRCVNCKHTHVPKWENDAVRQAGCESKNRGKLQQVQAGGLSSTQNASERSTTLITEKAAEPQIQTR